MQRFLLHPALLTADPVVLPAPVARQITRVLRLRAGERVQLLDGEGAEWDAELVAASPSSVTARLVECRWPEVELPRELAVAVAALKGEKLDWTVQKLTELGVSRILLLQTERTIVQAGEERWERKLERLREIIREAVEQSGRVKVPTISAPRSLPEVLRDVPADGVALLLDPRATDSLQGAVGSGQGSLLLLIGPEGGFSEAEAAACGDTARRVSLGRRILRAETAAIAAAALAAAAIEATA